MKSLNFDESEKFTECIVELVASYSCFRVWTGCRRFDELPKGLIRRFSLRCIKNDLSVDSSTGCFVRGTRGVYELVFPLHDKADLGADFAEGAETGGSRGSNYGLAGALIGAATGAITNVVVKGVFRAITADCYRYTMTALINRRGRLELVFRPQDLD